MTRYSITLVAYCLMPNHFHLLIKPEHDNVSQFMKSVFTSYTQAVNKQQGRQGPLFQGRFRAILVDEDEYLAHLARYIHLNPVAADLVGAPEAWAYSNYLDMIGWREGTLKDATLVPDRFPTAEAYAEFVASFVQDKRQAEGLTKYLLT